MKMKNSQKIDKHSASNRDQEGHIIEASKDVAILRDQPMETRIEEANKPMYLARYE